MPEHNIPVSTPHLPPMVELTTSHIADAAREAGEPQWMVDRRVVAWSHFTQASPPEWRRTDLTRLHPEHITPVAGPQGTAIQWDESLALQGVTFTTLKAALQSHNQIIKDKMGTAINPLSHKFSALRAALWQDGVFLYVPKNVEVEVPLRVCYTLADGSRSVFPYSLIIVEPNARLTFIEEFFSNDTAETALAGPTTEIFVGAGSELRLVTVQQWGRGVYHIGGQIMVMDRDASSEWVSVTLGGQVQHTEAEAQMKGDGSSVTWYGATFASEEQRLLTGPWLRHIGANTSSHMDFKTVVNQEGYSIFDGMIKIEHESSGTSTRLEEHAIHLTPRARSDSIPGLKIDTNDVAQAGHASTSGDVDEEQLFYMQSRGISKEDALHMIVMGLFEPALSAIPLDDVRETLTAAIEAKI